MRLQLGEWLNSFLVVVSAGHGLAEMVLLAARSFRGRPVCGSDVASLLLSGRPISGVHNGYKLGE
ncbi:hypothetical protein NC651_007289 [Populus alba x Populus x berolinensis]|nr:hypothetical protein NC651_007289 [Populus alba x Populus x berolinensis]